MVRALFAKHSCHAWRVCNRDTRPHFVVTTNLGWFEFSVVAEQRSTARHEYGCGGPWFGTYGRFGPSRPHGGAVGTCGLMERVPCNSGGADNIDPPDCLGWDHRRLWRRMVIRWYKSIDIPIRNRVDKVLRRRCAGHLRQPQEFHWRCDPPVLSSGRESTGTRVYLNGRIVCRFFQAKGL